MNQPRSVPAQRIGPARLGQPASNRNFSLSSAGGAGGLGRNLGNSASGGQRGSLNDGPRFAREGAGGMGGSVEEVEKRRRKKEAWGESYIPEEDSIRNDYSNRYVATGERPQNHLRNAGVEDRFKEYPKLASLLRQKHLLTSSPLHSIPPTYLTTPSISAVLPSLSPTRYDVILLTPPPEVDYEELLELDLGSVASTPGFLWLWVGSGGMDGIGLERGRELLATWGYRRCEDIVWLKTNQLSPSSDLTSTTAEDESTTLFKPTIEHCLMGIRGTVRRSNDPWFVHCNVDTDVLVWEGDPLDPQLKPPEIQSLIENFCLGTRRLHLYGSPSSLRRGWLTLGKGFERIGGGEGEGPLVREVEGEEGVWVAREYEREEYLRRWKRIGREDEQFLDPASSNGQENGEAIAEPVVESLLPFVAQLDALRPKSPPARNGLPSSGGLGRGRGAGLGITRSAGNPGFNGSGSMGVSNGSPGSYGGNGNVNGMGIRMGRGRGYGNQQPTPQRPYQNYSAPPPPPSNYSPQQSYQPYQQPYNPYLPPPSTQPYYPSTDPSFYPQYPQPIDQHYPPHLGTQYYLPPPPFDPSTQFHPQAQFPQQQQQQQYQYQQSHPPYPPPQHQQQQQQYQSPSWEMGAQRAAFFHQQQWILSQSGGHGQSGVGASAGGGVGGMGAEGGEGVEELERRIGGVDLGRN